MGWPPGAKYQYLTRLSNQLAACWLVVFLQCGGSLQMPVRARNTMRNIFCGSGFLSQYASTYEEETVHTEHNQILFSILIVVLKITVDLFTHTDTFVF